MVGAGGAQTAALIEAVRALSARVSALRFAEPVTHVYNPLDYARELGEAYLTRFGARRGRVLLLGMNPGPWGMSQTGVPFGEVAHVRDWMQLRGAVGRPAQEHPKRVVSGLECTRSEVSGARLWGWAAQRFGSPEAFFERFFVWNWCPLAFMESSGRNRTPDKLPAAERAALEGVCDASLLEIVRLLSPARILGVGVFAQKRAEVALGAEAPPLGRILHPSPASPLANRGWAEQAERQLQQLGLLTESD
ncbi:MAG: single-strand selective monofunctional uracil DNA glycosylase [Planctomycetota bacterium]|nr:MAG: single-strand selective monofunctional uracil DNA glycosylase [Planctomycetota bacterium]